eukprot:TRINITY_DN2989_c0_g1_i2.p1 TRINITY_DN2989_c0_g1~~TRINITY_DN2989_c0_g1_i2.p1  ORF type:complete len:1139 (-),score=330.95 TRINITY_DN2989_c0_g1_i2:173-3589(-)
MQSDRSSSKLRQLLPDKAEPHGESAAAPSAKRKSVMKRRKVSEWNVVGVALRAVLQNIQALELQFALRVLEAFRQKSEEASDSQSELGFDDSMDVLGDLGLEAYVDGGSSLSIAPDISLGEGEESKRQWRLWKNSHGKVDEQSFLWMAWRGQRFGDSAFLAEIIWPVFKALDVDRDHRVCSEDIANALQGSESKGKEVSTNSEKLQVELLELLRYHATNSAEGAEVDPAYHVDFASFVALILDAQDKLAMHRFSAMRPVPCLVCSDNGMLFVRPQEISACAPSIDQEALEKACAKSRGSFAVVAAKEAANAARKAMAELQAAAGIEEHQTSRKAARNAAATKLQATSRGRFARKRVSALKTEREAERKADEAAQKVASKTRGQLRNEAAVKVQARARGVLARKSVDQLKASSKLPETPEFAFKEPPLAQEGPAADFEELDASDCVAPLEQALPAEEKLKAAKPEMSKRKDSINGKARASLLSGLRSGALGKLVESIPEEAALPSQSPSPHKLKAAVSMIRAAKRFNKQKKAADAAVSMPAPEATAPEEEDGHAASSQRSPCFERELNRQLRKHEEAADAAESMPAPEATAPEATAPEEEEGHATSSPRSPRFERELNRQLRKREIGKVEAADAAESMPAPEATAPEATAPEEEEGHATSSPRSPRFERELESLERIQEAAEPGSIGGSRQLRVRMPNNVKGTRQEPKLAPKEPESDSEAEESDEHLAPPEAKSFLSGSEVEEQDEAPDAEAATRGFFSESEAEEAGASQESERESELDSYVAPSESVDLKGTEVSSSVVDDEDFERSEYNAEVQRRHQSLVNARRRESQVSQTSSSDAYEVEDHLRAVQRYNVEVQKRNELLAKAKLVQSRAVGPSGQAGTQSLERRREDAVMQIQRHTRGMEARKHVDQLRKVSRQATSQTRTVPEQASQEPNVQTRMVPEQVSQPTSLQTRKVPEEASQLPNLQTRVVPEQASRQPNLQTRTLPEQANQQPNLQARTLPEQASQQPNLQTWTVPEQVSQQPSSQTRAVPKQASQQLASQPPEVPVDKASSPAGTVVAATTASAAVAASVAATYAQDASSKADATSPPSSYRLSTAAAGAAGSNHGAGNSPMDDEEEYYYEEEVEEEDLEDDPVVEA